MRSVEDKLDELGDWHASFCSRTPAEVLAMLSEQDGRVIALQESLQKATSELETIKQSRDVLEAGEQSARARANALQIEYESRVAWIDKMNGILGYDNTDGFHSAPDPHELAGTYVRLLAGCYHAIKAYANGNSSPELAQEMAGAIEPFVNRQSTQRQRPPPPTSQLNPS